MGLGRFLRKWFGRSATNGAVLNAAAFAEAMAIRMRQAAPTAQVEVTGDLRMRLRRDDGGESTVFLDNAWHLYRHADVAERDDLLSRFVRSYLEAGAEMDADGGTVVPVIKHRSWLEQVRAAGDREVAHESLLDELVVVYAIDTPHNIAYVDADQLQSRGMGGDILRRAAVRNLRGLLPRIDVHRGERVSMVTADGNYEASLLLFDDLWERESARMSGYPVLAAPARDLMLFADSANTEAVAELRRLATRLLAEAAYGLSDRLYVWKAGQLAPLGDVGAG